MIGLVMAAIGALATLCLAALLRQRSRALQLRSALLAHVPGVTMLLVDRDLRFRFLDGAALEAHGWGRVELLGMHIDQVLPDERAAELRAHVQAALRGESSTVAWPGARGGVHFELQIGPLRQGRAITHAVCLVRDNTEDVTTAAELREQRGFLSALLAQGASRVIACDADGRLLNFDGPEGELFATPTDDLHPLEWAGAFGLLHPDGTPLGPHEAPLLRALRGQQVRGVEVLVDKPEGRAHLLCSGGPVTAADGTLLGAVITLDDLTGRRETEERLRVSEERHRRVVESMSDCVFETDARGRWTFLNRAWTEATGYRVADTIGRSSTDFVHPGDRTRHSRAFEPLLRGEQGSVQFSHRFLTSEGAVRWVDVHASTIPGWDGLPTGFVGVMRDVTDERRSGQHALVEQTIVRLLAGAESLEDAAPLLLEGLCRDLEWDAAELWRMGDDEALHRTDAFAMPDAHVETFFAAGGRLAYEVGDGLPGQAWMSREPLWYADLPEARGFGRRLEAAADGLGSAVVFPLRAGGAPVGVVQLVSRVRRDPEAGLMRPLETIGAHIGQFLQRRDAEQRAAERAADLTTIATVAHTLASQTDMYAARTTLVRAVRDVTGASCVVLWERTASGEAAEVTAADGAAIHGMTLALDGPTVTADVFANGELAFSADITREPRISSRWREVTSARSSAWVPVRSDGAVTGVLAVGWPQARAALPEREAELLRLVAAEAAITIHRTALLGSLHATARTDPLTGLPNRRVWDEDVVRELARARRHGGSLCLVMLDIDRFKAFNDHHGHQAGDHLLVGIAAAWRPILRATDTLARYGGEEFAILLPHSDADAAEAVVERLLECVPLGQTASAGIAVWDGAESGERLLARADAALYDAKAAGRARAVTAA